MHQVVGTNYTDIGFDYNPVTNILTIVAVLDNLIKGAAEIGAVPGLMLGFPQTDGLLNPTVLCLDEKGLVMKIIDGTIASPLELSADGLHAGFKKRS